MARKAAAGAGTIRKKAITRKGKQYEYWEARYTVGYDPGTGKQIQRSVTGKTQKEVRQKLQQATTAIDSGTYKEPCKMTLGEWLDIWTAEYLGSVKPRTVDGYKATVKTYIKPAIGAVQLEALVTHQIQRMLNDLQRRKKPLSAKTVRNVHGVLHKALQQAVDVGYLRENPSSACKLPRSERPEIKPLDDDATKRFMQVIRGHRFESVYLVTLFTGMREGEVLGLSWDNVDMNRGIIHVVQQLQRQADGQYHIETPKNGKPRTITPAPYVIELLQSQKVRQAKQRLRAGNLWEDRGFVFTDDVGHHLSPQTVYHNFKKLIADAGYPNTRFHDLRHSFAVASLQNGDDIKTVQENLGHYSAAFTLDVYGHVTEKMRLASADRMQRYIDRLKRA